MVKIKDFKENLYFNKIEKLKYLISIEEEFILIIEEKTPKEIEKKIENKVYSQKKKLFKLELEASDKIEYYDDLLNTKIERFQKKQNLEKRALKQTHKRSVETMGGNVKFDIDYDTGIKNLEQKEIQFLTNLRSKHSQKVEIARNRSKDEIDKKIKKFQDTSNSYQKELEEYKAYITERLNKKLSFKKSISNLRLNKLKRKLVKTEAKMKNLISKKELYQLPDDVILRLENLSMHFGGLKAVDNLNFDVKEGEIFGLIGPNGAGKTTVFNCITQFYKSTGGKIYYKDQRGNVALLNDIKVHNIIKRGIVRTFQNVELVWELSILDNLRVAGHSLYRSSLFDHFFHTRRYKKEEEVIKNKALKILEYLGLSIYKDYPPLGLPYGTLKRIELARTLMCNPKLIILDEPAAGLNDKETEELSEIILTIKKEHNCTIFLVEHDMSLVMDICDTVCAISFGKKLAIGTPEFIQNNAKVQEAYLGGE